MKWSDDVSTTINMGTFNVDFAGIVNEPERCDRIQNRSNNESDYLSFEYRFLIMLVPVITRIRYISESFDTLVRGDSVDYSDHKNENSCFKCMMLNLISKVFWTNESNNHDN